MELETKHGLVKIFAKTVSEKALGQIIKVANSPLGENAHIRIMPDCHEGKGCVIGTTMKIVDKVCPNLVGADIGCGVTLVKTNIDFKQNFENLDKVINKYVPYGTNIHKTIKPFHFEDLKCWKFLSDNIKLIAQRSLGTLGGGNHFIEAYDNGFLSVHSGSRNIGQMVAKYYQNLAEKTLIEEMCNQRKIALQDIPEEDRENYLKQHVISIEENLCYLTGQNLLDYLHDVEILQEFADLNRHTILKTIAENLGGKILEEINSVHNYIDLKCNVLRKGSISAQKDEILVIPLNMKDGMLICKGKGNEDWNYSAPHGAGRLYPRNKCKELFTVEEYQMEMEGIYSSRIGLYTLDEAPFVYKDFKEIMDCIEPSVEILERIKPIYNFKA